MQNYSHCPISEDGNHEIEFNKWTGKAKCACCGYMLVEVETKFKPYAYNGKHPFFRVRRWKL